MHPLSGADLATFVTAAGRAGGPSPRHWLQTAGIIGSILGRAPFSAIEQLRIKDRLPRLEDMPAPVFILGHWRSGTTHLYNIMAKGAFAYTPPVATGLPWDFMGLGTWLKPLLDRALPKHRWIDNVAVTPDAPQEDEIALANMTPLSFYHGVYFPKRLARDLDEGVFLEGVSLEEIARWEQRFIYLHRKLALAQDGRRLLIKNPVYTARVAQLRRLLPHAKFIHLRRDPYAVFPSMRNFYRRLLPPLALQRFDHLDIDALVLDVYARMMDAYARDVADLPAERLVEVAYEDLDADPIGTLGQIYGQLQLDGYEAARPAFEAYLASLKSYQKNAFTLAEADIEKVAAAWGRWTEGWGYSAPKAA